MASPQVENGFTRIANEILEALCRIRIAGEARQVIDVVLRKTYGYGKKEDCISLSQFCLLTGMRRGDVCRAINKAISMNIIKVISKKANGMGNKYCIVKDFDSWRALAKKQRGVAKKLITISKKANKGVAKKLHTIERVKERVKDNTAETSSAEIPLLIKEFERVDPKNKTYYGNTTQRKACSFLIGEYGFDRVIEIIRALPEINALPYVPQSTTPDELMKNWVKLENVYKKKKVELSTKGRGLEI